MRDGGVRQELANFLMGYADSLRDADAAVEDEELLRSLLLRFFLAALVALGVVLLPTRPVPSLAGTNRGAADRAYLVASRVESLSAARHDHVVTVQPITAAGTGRHSPMLKVNPPSGQDGKPSLTQPCEIFPVR